VLESDDEEEEEGIIIKFRHWPEHDFNSEQLFASLIMGDAMNIIFYDLMRLSRRRRRRIA
jgi:hypothetical protein